MAKLKRQKDERGKLRPTIREIAYRLYSQRRKCGMSMAALSLASGVDKGSISKYESGKRSPGPVNLKRLADALDVPVDWLLR